MELLLRVWVAIILVGLVAFPVFYVLCKLPRDYPDGCWRVYHRYSRPADYAIQGFGWWLVFCVAIPGVTGMVSVISWQGIKFVLGIS
jgi:hypothetical protein